MARRIAEATYTREIAGAAAGRTPATLQEVVQAALDDNSVSTMTLGWPSPLSEAVEGQVRDLQHDGGRRRHPCLDDLDQQHDWSGLNPIPFS